MFHECLKNLK